MAQEQRGEGSGCRTRITQVGRVGLPSTDTQPRSRERSFRRRRQLCRSRRDTSETWVIMLACAGGSRQTERRGHQQPTEDECLTWRPGEPRVCRRVVGEGGWRCGNGDGKAGVCFWSGKRCALVAPIAHDALSPIVNGNVR